jgi:N-acetyllactosaminide alpha-2,3-sialyltransferase
VTPFLKLQKITDITELNSRSKNNLFICYTPFHLNIAYSIIKKMNHKSNILVYLPSVGNKKNKYYYIQSKKYYKITYSRIIKSSYIKDFIYLNNLAKQIKDINIVYTGNLKTMYSRLLLSIIKYNSLCTFDDGVGHYYKSPYFSNTDEKIISKIFLRKNFYYSYLLSNVKLHFTLYPNKTINHKTIKLDYNTVCNSDLCLNISNKYALFLSRPLSEEGIMSNEIEIDLYKKIIKCEKIDYIQLHPSEKSNKVDLPIFNDYLVVEDLIISGCINKLIGFSTSSLIVSKILNPNIECIFYYLRNNKNLNDILDRFNIVRKKIELNHLKF